ncbi:hypothetical protein BDQ17DRAFT_1242905 [Cyathus striatus]|nr:hypothetical protein BDQ17DRAFT_1242905 [Cyathus striatus]
MAPCQIRCWEVADGTVVLLQLSLLLCQLLHMKLTTSLANGISEQHTEELIDVLKIPRDILESTAPGLRVAYQRYLACIKVVSDHNTMDKNRTWPIAKATKKEIVMVFVSSSAWYENYSNFDKIADFPAMQSWLAEDEDSPTDLDLWGFERDYYTFLDLKRWLKEKKEKRKGKGKGKGKSKEEKGGKNEKAHEDKEKSILAAGEQSFPNITFDVFSKFILSNFGENITLSATLVILFSMIDNVDLLSLHARQQNAKLAGENNVDATAWIRLLARAIQEKIGMDSDDLFDDYEINEHTTQTGRSILLGTKLDEMAKLLKLYPFNQERKVFEAQLKPVSHASIDPVHIICPIAAECETRSCKGQALHVHTKVRDVPKARLIKGSKIFEHAYVVSGVCEKCKTLYSAEHEQAYDEKQGYYMVHLNSAKYLKVGKKLWVDRAFSQGVLNGIYSFHASAAAYMEYWNNSFGNGKEISRRQVWEAFIHESIRMVSAGSGVNFISLDGLSITALTEEAFARLGENGKICASHNHSCLECTQPYRETQDSLPNESATVKMVVIDGIVMGPQHCAYDNCSNTLVNHREGVFCDVHNQEFGARCRHQEMWHKYNLEHSLDYLNGARRMLCKPAENPPWNKNRGRRVQQPHDESDTNIPKRSHYFSASRYYCVETICAPCGAVIAWTKFVKSESTTNILKFLEDVFPDEELRPDYICIDKAYKLLRTAVANRSWVTVEVYIVHT